MILVDKYANHQPLNRQSDRFACEGIELSVSTMADHVGACAATLMPLHELIKAHVFAAERIHGDDTTVPVLAKVKTRTGRIWTYVRDYVHLVIMRSSLRWEPLTIGFWDGLYLQSCA